MTKQIRERELIRDDLYKQIDEDEIDLITSVKLIRKIFGLNQEEYAKKIGISKKTLANFESGVGNLTIVNISKMLKPMGLELKVGRS
jgi:DNA-binding XRE family transcriptional regulator